MTTTLLEPCQIVIYSLDNAEGRGEPPIAGLLCCGGEAATLEGTLMATDDSADTRGLQLFGMRKTFISEVTPPQEQAGPAWWFAFHRNRLLVEVGDDVLRIPCRERFEELGVTIVQ